MRLPLGKLARKILENKVLKYASGNETVLLPPKFGEDGSVVKVGDEIIVSAADPITGATAEAGWLSVHVNANDVAVHAAKPMWYTTIILLPKTASEDEIERVMSGISEGLEEVKAVLIGGHTEVTERVNETIIAGYMVGVPMVKGRFVRSGDAKPGDSILVTKGAGIEGTYILATDFGEKLDLDKGILKRALEFKQLISVLRDVEVLVNKIGLEYIHAMHDATEGGLLGGVYEMSIASNLGFVLEEENIFIREETREICSKIGIDPLKLISSGTLIVAIDREIAEEAVKVLKKEGIDAFIAGTFGGDERLLVRKDGSVEKIVRDILDELWRIYGGEIVI